MTRAQPPGTIGIEPDYHSGDGGSRAITPMDPPGSLGLDHTNWQTTLDRYDMVEMFANRICDQYRRMSRDKAQIISIDIEGYEYLFDPALERVVGILGYSWHQEEDRDSYYMSSFLGRNTTQKLRKQLESRG